MTARRHRRLHRVRQGDQLLQAARLGLFQQEVRVLSTGCTVAWVPRDTGTGGRADSGTTFSSV